MIFTNVFDIQANLDKPLLMPKTEEADLLERQQEDSLLARMKMFVHLRQDLERVSMLLLFCNICCWPCLIYYGFLTHKILAFNNLLLP